MLKYPHFKDRYSKDNVYELLIKLEQEKIQNNSSRKKISSEKFGQKNSSPKKIKSVKTYWSSTLDRSYGILIEFVKVKKEKNISGFELLQN